MCRVNSTKEYNNKLVRALSQEPVRLPEELARTSLAQDIFVPAGSRSLSRGSRAPRLRGNTDPGKHNRFSDHGAQENAERQRKVQDMFQCKHQSSYRLPLRGLKELKE